MVFSSLGLVGMPIPLLFFLAFPLFPGAGLAVLARRSGFDLYFIEQLHGLESPE